VTVGPGGYPHVLVSYEDLIAKRPGATLWLTGLPAAGKTTLANAVERRLNELGRAATVLDGDLLRKGLSRDLDLSPAGRSEQTRRAAHVSVLLARAGLVAIVSLISPYAEDRRRAREIHQSEGLAFHEIWIDTPLRVCEERDPKGLYRRARAGELACVTGVDAPYEPPLEPELCVRGGEESAEVSAERVAALLEGVPA
jgi:bifunctional enzyme CysN/CysC